MLKRIAEKERNCIPQKTLVKFRTIYLGTNL